MNPSTHSDQLQKSFAAAPMPSGLPFLGTKKPRAARPLTLGTAWKLCRRAVTLFSRGVLPARARRMRLAESVSLGEKRVVSILEVDGREYLIGAANGSIALLTALPTTQTTDFQALLQNVQGGEQA